MVPGAPYLDNAHNRTGRMAPVGPLVGRGSLGPPCARHSLTTDGHRATGHSFIDRLADFPQLPPPCRPAPFSQPQRRGTAEPQAGPGPPVREIVEQIHIPVVIPMPNLSDPLSMSWENPREVQQ